MDGQVDGQMQLPAAWAAFGELRDRIRQYLGASETEFGFLIEALDECWTMTESVQTATSRLDAIAGGSGGTGDTGQDAMRLSTVEGCAVFRCFLEQIEGVGCHLTAAAGQTRAMLDTSHLLQADLGPLKYIAFHFRLQGAGLSALDEAAILKLYGEMREVLSGIQISGDSQEQSLLAILGKLGAATRSVEEVSLTYARRALASEERLQNNLKLLSEVPPELGEVRVKAASMATAVAACIRDGAKALQGHDAIRQRLEHILEELGAIEQPAAARGREGTQNEVGHVLAMQREQACHVRETIVVTGARIEKELQGMIAATREIAGDAAGDAAGDTACDTAGDRKAEANAADGLDVRSSAASAAASAAVDVDGHRQLVEQFEQAFDRLTALRGEVADLLSGEVEMGEFVLAQIDPIRGLLSAKSNEIEALARSMKRLALNVQIGASQMPGARGIDVLGGWTSEAAGRVLRLAESLNGQFNVLGETLQAQAAAVQGNLETVVACRDGLRAKADDAMRHSRRDGFVEVDRLAAEARSLQQKTGSLLQSLHFVDEGTVLLEELDALLEWLLDLYPKPERAFDHEAAAAGYTMQEQHTIHARAHGESGNASPVYARLAAVAEGEDYGDNIELF